MITGANRHERPSTGAPCHNFCHKSCYKPHAAPIDNNTAERAIKPFVLGLKAWLFSDTANGATSARIYNLVEIVKANGQESYTWLRHV
ncbi:Transposase IS66 family protein [compost metagenome]